MATTDLVTAAKAAAEAADLGAATARKTGRDARWPYVPVVRHHTGGLHGDGYDEQLLRRAYATRDEAVQAAGGTIAARRAALAEQLVEPRMRGLREQHGLARELTSIESEPEPRLVNCYQVHDIEVHPQGTISHRPLGIADGNPDRALADAVKARADGLLITDVLTGEQWYVPVEPVRTIAEWASIRHLQQMDAWHRDQGHVICQGVCSRWYEPDQVDDFGTCRNRECLHRWWAHVRADLDAMRDADPALHWYRLSTRLRRQFYCDGYTADASSCGSHAHWAFGDQASMARLVLCTRHARLLGMRL